MDITCRLDDSLLHVKISIEHHEIKSGLITVKIPKMSYFDLFCLHNKVGKIELVKSDIHENTEITNICQFGKYYYVLDNYVDSKFVT